MKRCDADRGRAAIGLPAAQWRALIRAKQLGGEIKYLSQGEIEARNRGYSPYSVETWRTWEYWANRAGSGHLLTRPDGGRHSRQQDDARDDRCSAWREIKRTDERRIEMGIGLARFPFVRDLDGFDFAAQPSIACRLPLRVPNQRPVGVDWPKVRSGW